MTDETRDVLDDLLQMRPVVFDPPVTEEGRIVSRAQHHLESQGRQYTLHIEVSEPGTIGVADHQSSVQDIEAGFLIVHLPDRVEAEDRDAEADESEGEEGLTFRIGPLDSAAALGDADVLFGVRSTVRFNRYDTWVSRSGGPARGQIRVTQGVARLRSGSRSNRRAAGQNASAAFVAATLRVQGESRPSATYEFIGNFREQ
ncbi:hypothetical protein JIG36_09590 [Actinoplanes sp. LDG1-06]|uniref:Uncharacterized protein n=1 Tax=Paractinoplanes ovalisporus TaxID=2810368 RepID=A0ABS2A7J7_9ACTN|nr:hypothetical protein [Actinoplanes ovalisporus]MBM2615807.1 hypothetical protein [Actinoplanes ovalisporus]